MLRACRVPRCRHCPVRNMNMKLRKKSASVSLPSPNAHMIALNTVWVPQRGQVQPILGLCDSHRLTSGAPWTWYRPFPRAEELPIPLFYRDWSVCSVS